MSVHSASTNDSNPHSNLSIVTTSRDLYCFISEPASFIFISYNFTTIFLLLPLCIFILYHGLQQWRSTSSASAISHSDSFTYHMVIMELIRVSGCTLCCCGVYSHNVDVLLVGFTGLSFTWSGEIFFHVLTCVERYLAVVHPITYMSLRKERGVRIRNISIGCVWLLCVLGICLIQTGIFYIIVGFILLISSLTVISFCSLSVLHVLTRSGPGEQVGRRERVDQSKLRAFYTIVAILGALVLRLAWGLVWIMLYISEINRDCLMMICELWVNVPSTLVLPLLFVHRTGPLMCCKTIIK